MHKGFICLIFVVLFFATEGLCEIDPVQAKSFGTDDLNIGGGTMTSYQASPGEHILVFDNGFHLVIGDNTLKSKKAVVWLNSITTEYLGAKETEYRLTVYLQDKVDVGMGRSSKMSGLEIEHPAIEGAETLVAGFIVNGEIYATADKQIVEDPRTSILYRNALLATGQIELQEETAVAGQESPKRNIVGKVLKTGRGQKKQRLITGTPAAVPTAPAPKFYYPVNISSATEKPVKLTNENLPDGTSIATVLDRFYLWQKQDESGRLLEFQSDNAVIFYIRKTNDPNKSADLLPDNTIKAIYLRGDIIMTEGNRTIRASEAYYDFQKKQALIINPVMQTYDPARGIPIYARADKIRQVAENKFSGENVTLTSSEFYVPKVSATASEIIITDMTNLDRQAGKTNKHRYDAEMKDIKFKIDNRTVFYWPRLRSDLERPDVPLKRLQFSQDKTFGTAIESEWYLARVLGLREPDGVDSSLMIDNYSKRGMGVGADINYEKETYYGNINGYVINDRGKDDLGRNRQNIQPAEELRGMFNFHHRQFLPYHWQLTLESSYLSDETFLESFHREDYFSGRGQETSVHLRWLKDNQAFAMLGRWRINDFADQLEDLPSAQYHLTGQSLWDDKLTLYSDSTAGRFRQLTGKNHNLNISDEYFTFGSHRTEIDFPLKYKSGNIVPFVAGIFGYDDRGGFERGRGIGTSSQFGEKEVFIGQAGVRASTQYWKNYNIHSKLWDIDGIRHIVKPYINASVFAESADVVEQRDVVTLGVLQRFQTKRGEGEKRRAVDWMRLNLEYNKVSNNSDIKRPDRSIWNNPFVPLSTTLAPGIFNSDLGSAYRTFEIFGPQRDSVNADYIWRLSDTTALLSDFVYDVKDKEFEQFNIGISRLVWPNLSIYLGTRYLRNVEVEDKKGSNALTFAATYKLNPRYTISFAHQYDFKRSGTIATQVSLIRRYHRLYYGLTYGVDESLDRRTIVLTIWPEGIGELFSGPRTVSGIDSPKERNY